MFDVKSVFIKMDSSGNEIEMEDESFTLERERQLKRKLSKKKSRAKEKRVRELFPKKMSFYTPLDRRYGLSVVSDDIFY